MTNTKSPAAPVSRAAVLTVALAALWWLLSGHTEATPVALGVLSVLFVVWFARRMDVLDHEGMPVQLTARAAQYWVWLAVQIYKANVDVAKRVLRGCGAITPTMVRVPCEQASDLGRVLYANSITLTPGTVSVHVTPGFIDVHSLTREGAEDLLGGDMCRRCTWFEGK